MSTDSYPARYRQLTEGFRALGEVAPGAMDGFGRLHRHAISDGVLSAKVKELMALSIAIAVRCDGCVAFHVHDAVRAGATAEEVAETIAVAIMMGGGASAVYATDALRAYEQFTEEAGQG